MQEKTIQRGCVVDEAGFETRCRQGFSLAVCLVFVCQLFAAALPAAAQGRENYIFKLNETFDMIPRNRKGAPPSRQFPTGGAEKPSGVMELDNGWLAYVQKNGRLPSLNCMFR